jgi:hypothetical protein
MGVASTGATENRIGSFVVILVVRLLSPTELPVETFQTMF